jgi:UDPglucose 6-dehydrogenase
VGADVVSVAEGIGLDSRIGPQFLKAGIGFGGSCFPKDVRAFIHLAETRGVNVSMLHEVERVNRERIDVFLKKLRRSLWVLRDKKIAVLGLAFKPATDDIREAPALKIIDALLKEGSSLRLYDPQGMPNTREVFPERAGRVESCGSAYEAARGTHALLLLTEWDEFRHLDFERLRDEMEVPIILDGRNLYDPETIREHGFEYLCMGRPESESGVTGPSSKRKPLSSRKTSIRGVLS